MIRRKGKMRYDRMNSLKKRKMFLPFLFLLIALWTPLLVHGDSVVAIKGGTILTMAGKSIVRGIVLIRDGKIAEIGMDVEIPEGAIVIDASDKYVMPGIVDAMSYYGIRPQDRNEGTNPVTPQNRIIQAYNPYSDYIKEKGYPTRNKEIHCGGVTALYIAPGNRQVIGGQGAVVKTYGNKNDDIILLEPASIDITMGDPVKDAFGTKNQSPMTRMSIAALLRKTLVSAEGYVQKLEAVDKKKEEAREAAEAEKDKKSKDRKKKGKDAAQNAAPPSPPPDLGMEAMAKLLRKEVPARFEANLTDDIRTAIRIAEEFGLRIVIDGGTGAYQVKDVLAEKQIPVVLSPISHPFISGHPEDNSPELYTLRNERTPALLAEAGVKIALASFGYGTGYTGSSYQGRWLLLEAALATGFGLSEEDALKAVTINPAEILGVADRIGSIEPGKDADIIILDRHPLDIKSWVEQVLIEGKVVYKK
ncbi:amidohydrolase family protein [Acidobacteriota bacterium]